MSKPKTIPIGFELNELLMIEAGDKVWVEQRNDWIGVQGSIGHFPVEYRKSVYIRPVGTKEKQISKEWGTW